MSEDNQIPRRFASDVRWESEDRLFAGPAYLGRVLPPPADPMLLAMGVTPEPKEWRFCTGAVDREWSICYPTPELARKALGEAVCVAGAVTAHVPAERHALEKAEAAMRLHGWHLALGSKDEGSAAAFAAWEAVDEVLHG